MIDIKKQSAENVEQYIWRICSAKDNGILDITWSDVANILNTNLCEDETDYLGESAYRKRYQQAKSFYENVFSKMESQQYNDDLMNQKIELEKQRIKTRDERTEYRRLIREQARKESYLEQIARNISKYQSKSLNYDENKQFTGIISTDNDMLIPLFDIHTGINSNNFCNTFNPDVLAQRLNKYLDRIFEIQLTNGCENAFVVISEIMSGAIHPTLRLENSQDLIEQFLTITDYLAQFISELSYRFKEVDVYVAPGNHSRMNAKKEENLSNENFDNLVIPYLEAKLQNFNNVICNKNNIEQSIAMFNIRGKKVFSSHGDKDSFENCTQKLTMFTGVKPDIILLGHKHTNAIKTDYNTKVLQTGSISGSDSYCMDHRISGDPEQLIAIVNKDGLVCTYDINLK